MQDAYHSNMRHFAAQNASRQASRTQPKARARVKAAEAPVVNPMLTGPMLIGFGVLSLIVAAFFSVQSF